MTFVPSINPFDNWIVCGRGQRTYNSSGNKTLRKFVAACLPIYTSAATSRTGKTELVDQTTREILGSGMKFVKLDRKVWKELSFEEARTKVAHRFRDAVREVQNGDVTLESVVLPQLPIANTNEAAFWGKRCHAPAVRTRSSKRMKKTRVTTDSLTNSESPRNDDQKENTGNASIPSVSSQHSSHSSPNTQKVQPSETHTTLERRFDESEQQLPVSGLTTLARGAATSQQRDETSTKKTPISSNVGKPHTLGSMYSIDGASAPWSLSNLAQLGLISLAPPAQQTYANFGFHEVLNNVDSSQNNSAIESNSSELMLDVHRNVYSHGAHLPSDGQPTTSADQTIEHPAPISTIELERLDALTLPVSEAARSNLRQGLVDVDFIDDDFMLEAIEMTEILVDDEPNPQEGMLNMTAV